MGQRSQIYLRYNGRLVFAQYYQWNYAERMISRARWGIEHVKERAQYPFTFRDPSYVEEMRRIFDVNFDMRDVQISINIVKEYNDLVGAGETWMGTFNEYVFNKQDNNDGQLFVDIQDNDLYYCFRAKPDRDDDEIGLIMDAKQYMAWDMCDSYMSHLCPDEIKTYEENCKAIKEMATLMTPEQLSDFLHGDYSTKTGGINK